MCSDRKAVSRRGDRTAGGFKKAEDLDRTIDKASLIAKTACRKCRARLRAARLRSFRRRIRVRPIFGRHLIEHNRQCGTPKCEYPPKRTPAWTTSAAAKRCLDGEEKNQLLSRAAF